jgi:hypothetical protein
MSSGIDPIGPMKLYKDKIFSAKVKLSMYIHIVRSMYIHVVSRCSTPDDCPFFIDAGLLANIFAIHAQESHVVCLMIKHPPFYQTWDHINQPQIGRCY